MGYRGTVKSNVNKAFRLLKDLAVPVTLTSKSDSGFDFATNSVKTPVSLTKPIMAIPVTKRRSPDGKGSHSLQHSFLLKASDIDDPTIYDTLSVLGVNDAVAQVWKVVPPYENDGYTITVNVSKEA